MPEGPELHLASLYVNKMCEGVVFAGAVQKSEVSKNPDVPFTCEAYRITAASRGKEVKLTLAPMKSEEPKRKVKAGQAERPVDVVFRFGMSGFFRFTAEAELPKHAHLRFYTKERPRRVLSYVDARRFGSWQSDGAWQADRGPCVMFEYKSFRENVVSHLSDRAFDRPICEVLLNQKYFNGIGNYLRAEILYRLEVPPFTPARAVLEGLGPEDGGPDEGATKYELTDAEAADGARRASVKEEAADLLRLCHTVPMEVVRLGGKGYDPQKEDYSGFQAWLRCYYVDGMKSLRDHNGRTVWYKGDPGPMAPKDAKSPKAKKRVKKEDHDYTEQIKPARSRPKRTSKERAGTQDAVAAATTNKVNAARQRGSKGVGRREANASPPETRGAAAGPERRSRRAIRRTEK